MDLNEREKRKEEIMLQYREKGSRAERDFADEIKRLRAVLQKKKDDAYDELVEKMERVDAEYLGG